MSKLAEHLMSALQRRQDKRHDKNAETTLGPSCQPLHHIQECKQDTPFVQMLHIAIISLHHCSAQQLNQSKLLQFWNSIPNITQMRKCKRPKQKIHMLLILN
mmetsp:Transcript_1209/g.1947  ORF Transcript_1209/g.1947 Transcript_1209/m.1947 type:complete len:102 (+) Transcript_1209:124-429(+)